MAQSTTTLQTWWNSFFAHMSNLEGQSGNGSSVQIEDVVEGEALLTAYEIPYLSIQLIKLEVDQRVGGANKSWKGDIKFRVVTRGGTGGLSQTNEIMAKIAQVQDRIDSFQHPPGGRGLESALWSTTFPTSADEGINVMADMLSTFFINTAEGSN